MYTTVLLLIATTTASPPTLAAAGSQAFYVCQLRVPGPDGAASSEHMYLSPVFPANEPDTGTITFAWYAYMAKQLALPSSSAAYRNCQKSQHEQDPAAMAAQWEQRAKSLGQQVTKVDWRYMPAGS